MTRERKKAASATSQHSRTRVSWQIVLPVANCSMLPPDTPLDKTLVVFQSPTLLSVNAQRPVSTPTFVRSNIPLGCRSPVSFGGRKPRQAWCASGAQAKKTPNSVGPKTRLKGPSEDSQSASQNRCGPEESQAAGKSSLLTYPRPIRSPVAANVPSTPTGADQACSSRLLSRAIPHSAFANRGTQGIACG